MMTHGFYDGSQPGLAVATQYDPSLVFLSIAIACLASYAALNIAGRIGASEKNRSQQVWILAGAWSMGIGIWAMHFIGMLALKLPLSVSYDLLTTVLFTIPAILGGAIMMSVIVNSRHRRKRVLPRIAICEVPISSGFATSSTAELPWPIFQYAWRWSIWRASERKFPFKKFACCSLHSSSVLRGTSHVSKEI